jgi:uroporphyrinogen-III synthase
VQVNYYKHYIKNNMLLINTRPSDRAAALSAALLQQDIPVFELPLLELHALNYDAHLHDLYAQLIDAQVIVVVSPTAVEIGMQYLQKSAIRLSDLQHIQWIAVGAKTAQALAAYGIDALIPEVETSEGMLQLPSLQALATGSCIAFWRGEGGRQFMMQQLQDAGMQILNFVLYQRNCPSKALDLITPLQEKIKQHEQCSVLITSEASWLNWLKLLQQQPSMIQQARYLVLGSRLAKLLTQYKNQHDAAFEVVEFSDLNSATILAYLASNEGQA